MLVQWSTKGQGLKRKIHFHPSQMSLENTLQTCSGWEDRINLYLLFELFISVSSEQPELLNTFCGGMMSLFLKALQTLPAFDFWVFKLVRLKRWFDKPSKDVLNGKVEWRGVCLRLTVTACWPCCITVEVGTEKGQTINKLKKKFQITFVETADFFYSQKKLIIPKESFTKHKLSHHIRTVHPERSIYCYYPGHKKT